MATAGVSAAAELTDVKYDEVHNSTEDRIRWEFRWSGIIPAMDEVLVPSAAASDVPDRWKAEINLQDLAAGPPFPDPDVIRDDLLLNAEHIKLPHGTSERTRSARTFIRDIDALPSTLPPNNNPATVPNSQRRLRGNNVHARTRDIDVHTVRYTANAPPAAGRQVTFFYTVRHERPKLTAFLDSSGVVPPSDSSASGLAVLYYDDVYDEILYAVELEGLDVDGSLTPADPDDDVIGIDIHLAAAGEVGDVVYSIFGDGHDLDDAEIIALEDGRFSFQGAWDEADVEQGALPFQEIQDLLFEEALYVDVHTMGHPDGAVRGQIGIVPPEGDTNGDGAVNIDDLNAVRNFFGQTGRADGSLPGDAWPFDGAVNIDDLNAVRNNFGGQAAVPEPASGGQILLFLLLTIMARRVRWRGKC
jgi:hypothetical protein